MRSFLSFAGAALMIVLLALLLAPGGTVDVEEIIWDKAAHFIAFGLILWSLGVLFRRLPRVAVAALAVVIGAAVEVLQGYVGRDPSWGDLLADILGVGTALLMWVVWRRFRTREAFQTGNTL
ncbi:MAG: VanZ family protein [Brevundimonas sp.]